MIIRARGLFLLLALGLAARAQAVALMPLDQVKPGQTGYGSSVFEGTKIERFDIEVVGLLRSFDFQMDMILIEVKSGPVVTRNLGSVAGMSGSPIYVNNKLIGAYAYGFPFQKNNLAGVTPIEQMMQHADPKHPAARAAAARRERQAALAAQPAGLLQAVGSAPQVDGKKLAEVALVANSRDAASARLARPDLPVMAPVATPLLVSGMGGAALSQLTRLLEPFNLQPMQAGSVQAPAGAKASFMPGAAVGVALATGDIEMTAVGTLTYREGDTVMAFGHPFMGLGDVDLPMTSAYIAAIVPNLQGSFKLGGAIAAVGSVTQDRPTCIAGTVGDIPAMIPAAFAMRDLKRENERRYRFKAVRQGRLTPMIAAMLLNGSMSNAAGEDFEGVVTSNMQIGLRNGEDGERLEVVRQDCVDTQLSPFGMLGPVLDLTSIISLLHVNPWGKAPVQDIAVDVAFEPERKLAAIERIRAAKRVVKRGETVAVTAYLREYGGKARPRELRVTIPDTAPLGPTLAIVAGGAAAGSVRDMVNPEPYPVDVPSMVRYLNSSIRNDSLVVELVQPTSGLEMEGRVMHDLPDPVFKALETADLETIGRRLDVIEQIVPSDDVITGAGVEVLEVVGEDGRKKDRGTVEPEGMRPAPAGPMGGQMGMGMGLMLSAARRDIERLLGRALTPEELQWWAPDGNRDAALRDTLSTQIKTALGRLTDGVGRLKPQTPQMRQSGGAGPVAVPEAGAGEGGAEPTEEEPDITAQLDLGTKPDLPGYGELEAIKKGELGSTDGGGEGSGSEGTDGGEDEPVARGVTTWTVTSVDDWAAGRFERTYADSAGSVYRGPRDENLGRPDAERIWAVLPRPDGSLIVGSWGAKAKLIKVVDGEEPKLIAELDEAGIGALAALTDGSIVAGAVPSGKLYRLAEGGEPTVLATLPEPYIWALSVTPDGDLFAATGNHGRLYRVGPDGQFEVVATVPDRHITSLARTSDGDWLAGTFPDGKAFRVRDGQVTTVHQVSEGSITAMAVGQGDVLYVGTSDGAVERIDPDGQAKALVESGGGAVYGLVRGIDAVYAVRSNPAQVVRLAPDDTVASAFEDEEPFLLGAALDSSDRLVAATAAIGRVLRIATAESDNGLYTSTVHDCGMTARFGQLRWQQRLGGASVIGLETRSGNTVDPDAAWSEWSPMLARADGSPIQSPAARYVQFRARFLGSGPQVSALDRVDLQYRTINRGPTITFSEPDAGGHVHKKVTIKWAAADPDEDKLTFTVYYAPAGTTDWTLIETKTEDEAGTSEDATATDHGEAEPSTDAGAEEQVPPAAGASEVQGAGTAAARFARASLGWGGPQRASVGRFAPRQGPEGHEAPPPGPPDKSTSPAGLAKAASSGDEEAKPLEGPSDLTDEELEWDTTGVSDGAYVVRVVASDAKPNPDDPRSAEVISRPFFVDNTAPTISAVEGADGTFTISDALSWVTSAEYQICEAAWIGWVPEDGLADEPVETFVLKLSEEQAKGGTLRLRARDAAGNLYTTEWPPAPAAPQDGAEE